MGTTPYFGLPYPASSDPVASGATNFQDLANYTETSLFRVQATAGLRNKLINGSMEFWQRGTTAVTADQTYSADRWICQRAISTMSVTRAAVAPNAATPGPIKFATAFTVTSGGTAPSYAILAQRIEDVGTLAGSTVTVSFYAYASVANLEIGCSLQQNFGTGGSPSANVDVLAYTARKTASLSTSAYNRYEFSFIVPNISGKTRGTNGNDYLSLFLWLDAGSNFNTQTGTLGNQSGTFYITGVQLEEGPGPSKFEQRDRGLELSLCQRYFCSIGLGANSYLIGITYTAGATITSRCNFPVTMRTSPIVTFISTGRYVSTIGVLSGLTFVASSTVDAAIISGPAQGSASYGWIDLTGFNATAEL
jgi:hypothetical protein